MMSKEQDGDSISHVWNGLQTLTLLNLKLIFIFSLETKKPRNQTMLFCNALTSFAVFAVVVSHGHGALANADRALALRNAMSTKADFEARVTVGPQDPSKWGTAAETTGTVPIATVPTTGLTASEQGECPEQRLSCGRNESKT